ncbi:hypothetical protein C8F04DRAFT_962988, partial [Mycena alexandri]
MTTDIYVCSRQGSGGKSKYQKKRDWGRKISSKRTGCPCRLTVKTYPGTSEVLGFYKSDHSHATGDENLKYLRLDKETRLEIETMLRLGVEPKKILENITQGMYHERNLDKTRSAQAHRRDFVTRADVRRIQKIIEEESIRLAAQDGPSVLEWVEKLKDAGHFTKYQCMPAAFMVSSNGKEVTVDHFLATIVEQNPTICPHLFMSDFDWCQLNSIARRYPKFCILLCWWHVLHAWQGHFVTQHYPVLWERLKTWIRITDQEEFNARWAEIKTLAPKSIRDYLETFYMPVVHMWSAVYRSDRSIFETCDTNMLVEAHRQQVMGFEGPDLALKHRMKVVECAELISKEDIQYNPESGKYIIRSQADPEIFYGYEVDLDAYDCTCLSFPLIRFCKHICAVRNHFPEEKLDVPVALLNTHREICSSESSSDDSEEELEEDITQNVDSDRDSRDATAPLQLNEAQHASISDATRVLDRLSIDLAPCISILLAKVKVAPNQHSWSETRAVMGVPVK